MDEPGVQTDRVWIFDTTLRDGEQSPGASLTSAEKIDIARQLARLGVDIIEAGFPAASPDDLEGVRRIAHEVGTPDGPVICGLARATKNDIDKAWEAVQGAAKPRIHTFLATSDIHMEHKLRMTREQVIERVREMVAYARSLCADVEFSPEDACRSDPDFLVEVLSGGRGGRDDTQYPGYSRLHHAAEYSGDAQTDHRDGLAATASIWSVHCHDDLGMATANTLPG